MTEVAALRLLNSQHAAILQIPSEIIVSIFRHFIKTSPGYQEAVLLISSICYYLRTLVFGTPELWGFVNMRGSLGPLFLERCQWNPISVVPYFTERDLKKNARIYTCLNFWKCMPNLHLTRVELVEFCGTLENFRAFSWIFNYHLPNLETLTLASGGLVKGAILSLEEDPEVWNVNLSTGRMLKDVHLQQIFVPWASNVFYGLSTLSLDYRGFIPGATSIPMDAFLEVLSRSPRLEMCSLYSAIPQCHNKELLQDLKPARIVELPLLEELILLDETLNMAYLIRHLRFPSSTKTLLRVETTLEQLEGLLSTLFPPNSNSSFDGASRIALQRESGIEYRPALMIGNTTIRYLAEWDGRVVGPNDIAYTTFSLPLVEAVHRAGPSVRVLRIGLGDGLVVHPMVWKDILERLPNLEELVYAPGEGGDPQWPVFWNLLCQKGENGLICPSLRSLRITSMQGIPPDSVACLAARWKLEKPLGVFQLRVGNCERSVAEHTVAYLRPFVGNLIFEVIEQRQIVSPKDFASKPFH